MFGTPCEIPSRLSAIGDRIGFKLATNSFGMSAITRRFAVLASTAALLLVGGCWGFMHDEVLDGPYRLVAVDSMDQMALCRDLGDGNCAGDGLLGETVFAAGANKNYVVIARHPGGDPTRTEFHYLIRTPDEARGLPTGNVKGPFDAQQFEREKQRLNLPEFSRVFSELS